MSKEAALRAMREAKYARQSAAARPAGSPATRALRTPEAAAPVAPPLETEDASDGLCGHRSMNGRTCTREHGHAAKSHRYS
jgi:hypothetical protein